MTEAKRPWRDYFDNEYLTGDALPDEGRTFTIDDKSRAEVEGHDGGKEHKLVLVLHGAPPFLCNVTNAKYIEHMIGSPYPADWVGHRITLAFDESVMFGKERVGGIRVIGSPELTEPITFMFAENSRKRPRPVTLVPTGDVTEAEEPRIPAEVAEDGGPAAFASEEPDEFFDAENDEIVEPLDLALGNVEQIRPPAVTAAQVKTIKGLVKESGIYEVELLSVLDSYGANSVEGLSKKNAEFVIAALRERGAR